MAAQASAIADEDILMIARYFSSLRAPNTMRVDQAQRPKRRA
jgi:cytochrome c553